MTPMNKKLLLAGGGIAILALIYALTRLDMGADQLRFTTISEISASQHLRMDEGCNKLRKAVTNSIGDTLMFFSCDNECAVVVNWASPVFKKGHEPVVHDRAFEAPYNTVIGKFSFQEWPFVEYHSTDSRDSGDMHIYIDGLRQTDPAAGNYPFNGKLIQFSNDGEHLAYAFRFSEEIDGIVKVTDRPTGWMCSIEIVRPQASRAAFPR